MKEESFANGEIKMAGKNGERMGSGNKFIWETETSEYELQERRKITHLSE